MISTIIRQKNEDQPILSFILDENGLSVKIDSDVVSLVAPLDIFMFDMLFILYKKAKATSAEGEQLIQTKSGETWCMRTLYSSLPQDEDVGTDCVTVEQNNANQPTLSFMLNKNKIGVSIESDKASLIVPLDTSTIDKLTAFRDELATGKYDVKVHELVLRTPQGERRYFIPETSAAGFRKRYNSNQETLCILHYKHWPDTSELVSEFINKEDIIAINIQMSPCVTH